MTNVVSIRTGQPIHQGARLTSGSHRDGLSRQIVISPKPSWLTGCDYMNRAVTRLEEKGWTVEVHPSGEIMCMPPHRYIGFIEAQEIQQIIEKATGDRK